MDFIITEQKATICLNMIVKNESHIIEKTLEKLLAKIKFDYWVICDTGSTDNTPQLITDFFGKHGIQGELFHDEWNNFAHNRTLALERAYKKTDLLLVFDADDEIVGDFVTPSEVLYDEYHLQFGSSLGISYTRVLLINNHKKFHFLSVIHEFISCKEGPTSSTTISGNYFVHSGRTGARNQDPDKYLKDALVLEKEYEVASKNNDQLFHRYAFYCANSYKDCGKFEEAIKWYKITLSHEQQWPQEKYVSCLYINDCFNNLKTPEFGFFYLVKAFQYDSERGECLFPLLQHYCCENSPRVAYNYYLNVKDYLENKYLNINEGLNEVKKLFVIQDKLAFFVPYYMILIADKVQDFACVVKMFEIIFTKKQLILDEWYIKNLLYNLQFFLQHIKSEELIKFISLTNDYLKFLSEIGINLQNFDFLLKDEYKKFGLNVEKYLINEISNKSSIFSKDECSNSKNILIYTGFSDINWNYSYMSNNALGGSEKAVNYLSKCFPKDYTIYIGGHVKNESIDNIHYIHLDELTKLINETPFHTVIVSRYISFYEMFQNCSFYQSFIWAHDTLLLPYGSSLNEKHILKKWDKYINGCVCLTEWHRNLFVENYPVLKNKIQLINNGLDLDSFTVNTNIKIKNKFIYTSRPDRGLNNLLKLWPQILEKIPDATLTISTYGNFPTTPEDKLLKIIIEMYPKSITHLGKLCVNQLYEEMASSEFWLYPTHWPETSCITALEMLMSKVICIYYPVAGLTNTIDKYGIQVSSGKEIETIVSLTEEQKVELRNNGRVYAEKCSWENRSNNWCKLLFKTNKNIIEDKTDKFMMYTSTCIIEVIEDYIIGIKEKYNIEVSNNLNYIIDSNPNHIFIIGNINQCDYDIIKQNLPSCKISLINLEPLNLEKRIKQIKSIYSSYNIKVYDYSLSNIEILMENGITNIEYLPYFNTENETKYLTNLYNNTEKIYDFGILTGCGAPNNLINELGPKRKKLVEYLLTLGFKVNIIKAWGEERDKQLAKCNIILNIHGQLLENNYWYDSNIFEHLRCDRLLNSGFKILSEKSHNLDNKFIQKYPNLTIINYIDFFNLETYSKNFGLIPNINNIENLIIKKNYCFIQSCNLENIGTYRLEYLIKRIEESKTIDIFEKIYIVNIGIPIESTYGLKYEIINYSTNTFLYEAPAINKIQDFSSQNPNCNILYIHTKGIRYDINDQKENDWIDLMLYFLLDKHSDCIQKLNENYDIVGCNYYCKIYHYIQPHFSGNFWWANTNYLKSLNKLDESLKDRNSCEFWLFRNSPIFYTLHNSNVDHYLTTYPKELYQTKIINNETNNLDLGFIILRNVISKDSNKYWFECYNSIRNFYPEHKIVIIDVSSEKQNILEKNLTNTIIVNSTYNSSYNTVPYLYYLENNHFSQAVIIKDTMIFTKYINFDNENRFLWEFEHNWDDNNLEVEIIKQLDNFQPLLDLYFNKSDWKGCFQSMSKISHNLLQKIHSRYNLYKISSLITDEHLNSCFERIFAVLFILENGGYKKSICGNFHWTTIFSTTYDNYLINKHNNIYWLSPIVNLFFHEFIQI